MSLTSMLRSSLGMSAPAAAAIPNTLTRKAGIAAGAFLSGYANGRFSSSGKDHYQIKLPAILGGATVPADVGFVIVMNALATVDMVPFGLDEFGLDLADGVLGQIVGRHATAMGSEHKLAALSQSPQKTVVSGSNEVIDMRPQGARRYKMTG